MKIDLDINGFLSRVEVIPQQIHEVYKPILKKIELLYRRKTNSNRIKVLLAGPPGSGKSTFSKILELLAPKETSLSIQSLSLDGFHYPNDYLNTNFSNFNGEKIKLRNIKGAPETYDIESLLSRWDNIDKSNISWPVYDRNLHDPSPERNVHRIRSHYFRRKLGAFGRRPVALFVKTIGSKYIFKIR